jgi:cysteine desulfuration protein SufE
MSLEEIRADFELLDDWEDRYRYVIELGRTLPPLEDGLRTDANKVRGCASQVWLISRNEPGPAGSAPRLRFEGDSDAHIVRGLIAILLAAIDNRTAAEIESTDLGAIFAGLGLREHLTPQRSNGLAAMIERIRSDARSANSSALAAGGPGPA